MYQILVVDDEENVRRGIIEAIDRENLGIDAVYEAETGKTALSFMDIRQIDLVITDIRMPEMGGIELIQQLRSRNRELPIIVISGYSDFSYLQAAIRYGVNDYILKPIRPLDLNGILESVFEQIEKSYIHLDQQAVLREVVLCRMVSGTISRQEAREKLENAGVVFRRGKYRACIIHLQTEGATAYLYKIAAVADRYLSRERRGAAFVNSDREVTAILWGNPFEEKCREELQNYIEKKSGFACRLTTGDEVDEIEEIPYSYETAKSSEKTWNGKVQNEHCSKIIRDVLSYIDRHYMEKITLKEMGDRFSVNASYLGYLFKKETGSLFNDYVNQMKISYARSLLADTSMKVYEVMEKTGIQDSHYFIRLFKKYAGVSPSEYRKSR